MITGGWEPISLSSINRNVLYTSTGHGPVPLSISSATHRIERTICFTIMDQLPTISPPQRAKFRRKSVPPRPKTVAARPRRPPPRLSARRRVCCSHPPRRTTHPERRGSDFFPLAGEETAHGQDLESSDLYLIYGEFIRVQAQAVCLEFRTNLVLFARRKQEPFAPGFAFLCSNGGSINYAMP